MALQIMRLCPAKSERDKTENIKTRKSCVKAENYNLEKCVYKFENNEQKL